MIERMTHSVGKNKDVCHCSHLTFFFFKSQAVSHTTEAGYKFDLELEGSQRRALWVCMRWREEAGKDFHTQHKEIRF